MSFFFSSHPHSQAFLMNATACSLTISSNSNLQQSGFCTHTHTPTFLPLNSSSFPFNIRGKCCFRFSKVSDEEDLHSFVSPLTPHCHDVSTSHHFYISSSFCALFRNFFSKILIYLALISLLHKCP